MLRLAHLQAVRLLVAHPGQVRRSLVSPVLLTRTWENENVATLRREAKNRGLSARGSKANLILRITEHDSQGAPKDVSAPTPANTRSASSSVSPQAATLEPTSHTVAPGPGVPNATATSVSPSQHNIFNVAIPDLSQPDSEPPVEVPYVPDFWDSTAFKEQAELAVTEDLPKMVVVGGVSTHSVGPTHNLEAVTETGTDIDSTTSEAKKSPVETTVFEDITQDLGLPPPKELKQSFWRLFS